MTYATTYAAATDAAFQGRCIVATWVAAQDILSESTNTPDHQARLDWANRVLTDATNMSPRVLAMQVLRNAVIAANPSTASDSDIQFQVNSTIDALVRVG